MVAYSTAARCAACGHRAVLDRAGVDALVTGSRGTLEAFPCHLGEGSHVWSPRIETPRDDSLPAS